MSEKETLQQVIRGYRKVIEQRYQYDAIQAKYELPEGFDEERVQVFRDYFLEYMYPPPEQREELDAAFERLDDYIKQPEKLLRIVLDSSRLLFKYGRHLPKILIAGMKALKSFRSASRFEHKLVQSAMELELEAPYGVEEINTLLASLSRRDIEQFIKNNETLFDTLHDRKLVRKVIEIVQYLVAAMQKRPNIYSTEEIKALELGYNLIKEGDALFDQLSKENQQRIFEFVVQIEKDTLEQVFSKQ